MMMMNILTITTITTFPIIIFISSTLSKINAYNYNNNHNAPSLDNNVILQTPPSPPLPYAYHRHLTPPSSSPPPPPPHTTSPTHYPPITLSTSIHGGNIESYGNMFDLRTRQQNISILSLSILTRAINTNVSYAVYTKPGTYRQFQRNASSWTLLSSGHVLGRGDGEFTPLPPFNPPIELSPRDDDDRRAFYVTLTSPVIIYENGTSVGQIATSDADLELFEGIGVTLYPFGPVVSPRLWKGEVSYRVEGRTNAPSMVPSGSPSIEIFVEIFDYEFEIEAFPATEVVLDDISDLVLGQLEVLWSDATMESVFLDWGADYNMPKVTLVESTNNFEQSLISTVVTLERDGTISPEEIRYALLSFSQSIATTINAKYVGPDTLSTEKVITLSGHDLQTLNQSDIPLFENGIREFLAKSTSSYSEYIDILFVHVIDQVLSSAAASSRQRWRYNRHLVAGNDDDDDDGATELEEADDDESLDVTIAVTGEYYPPPTIDFSYVVEDAVSENSAELVVKLRETEQFSHFSKATVVKSTTVAPSAMPTVMYIAMKPNVSFWDNKWAIWVVVGGTAVVGSALLVACFIMHTRRDQEKNTKLVSDANQHRNLHELTRGGVKTQ